jgi:hypothetical protein
MVYSYPERSLQGSLTREAGLAGVNGKDVAMENKLIAAVAQNAVEEFAQMAAEAK